MTEINKDFYCTTDCRRIGAGSCGKCYGMANNVCKANSCSALHRKWPTPEQFEEEYGHKYHDDGAVYAGIYYPTRKKHYGFSVMSYIDARSSGPIAGAVIQIVCACTPFGKPGKDWRPE